MNIIVLSDTHGLEEKTRSFIKNNKADVLIHCGDWSHHLRGDLGSLNVIASFMGSFSHIKHKLIIAGNHDFIGEKQSALTRNTFQTHNVLYLHDQEVIIDGIKFYGTPYQPEFGGWAFNLPRNGKRLKQVWDNVPYDTNVLITHSPPCGILDRNINGIHCGCELLRDRIDQLPVLKYHLMAHIHESAGSMVLNGIRFINASVVDEKYLYRRDPILFTF